jgi:hypothetical protein
MNIRNIYLYLFSFIGLLMLVIGLAQMVDLAITVWVFPEADLHDRGLAIPSELNKDLSEAELQASVDKQAAYSLGEQSRSRQRQLSSSLSMLVVGLPLYLYHWRTINSEKGKSAKPAKK